MDRLQSLRAFQEVIDAGGFAAAARKLDLSPAVVTRLIGDLESTLGARLLHRTTRRVTLTPAGEAYLERVRRVIAELDDATAMVQAETRQMQGTVRLSATTTVTTHVLAPAITDFQRDHPLVHFELHSTDMPAALLEEVDIAFVSGTAQLSADVVARTIFVTHTIACAAPAYLQEHGEPRSFDELVHHRWLRMREEHHAHQRLRMVDPGSGQTRIAQVQPVVLANGREPLLRATLEGAGLSIQPVQLIAPLLEAGSLRWVLRPWVCEESPLIAAMPTRRFLPERVRAFLDHLGEQARRRSGEFVRPA